MSWLKAKDWATGVEYSTLFHSGLRAISRRPRACRTRTDSSSSSPQERSSSRGSSSILPLSSRLFRRSARSRRPSPATSLSTDSNPTPPPHAPKVTRPRPSSMFVQPTKEMADTRSSGECFYEIGEYPKFPEEERRSAGYLMPPIEIDAVRSLATSRSIFVNLGEMDTTAVPEESFLLLSSDPDGFLHRPLPQRERPMSMQTMPLPSRRSPVHYRTARETRRERGDCAWMLEESSPELKVYELEDEDEELRLDDERSDVADWRQFHVDWLQTIH